MTIREGEKKKWKMAAWRRFRMVEGETPTLLGGGVCCMLCCVGVGSRVHSLPSRIPISFLLFKHGVSIILIFPADSTDRVDLFVSHVLEL
jgi:hypothetical protein